MEAISLQNIEFLFNSIIKDEVFLSEFYDLHQTLTNDVQMKRRSQWIEHLKSFCLKYMTSTEG